MTKVFVDSRVATKELMGVIRAVAAAGYDKSQVVFGAGQKITEFSQVRKSPIFSFGAMRPARFTLL